jgi:AcrR family transcriptional regulator
MIEAAYRALSRDTSQPVSVARILDATGLGTRAFYRHFRSKDDLLLAMFRRDSELVTAELEDRVAAAGDPLAALEAWVDQLLSLLYDPRRFRRVQVMMSAEVRRVPGYGLEQKTVFDAQRAVLAAILERGRGDGTFPQAKALPDARAIQAITNRLIDERSNGIDTFTWDEARSYILDVAGRIVGLTPERRRRRPAP